MPSNRNVAFLLLFGGALIVTMFVIAGYALLLTLFDRDVTFGESVAVVDIRGEIVYDRAKLKEIESYRDDDDVRAVLLFINSPGGGVSASQAIHRAVISARQRKPVVAFMASVAASGGYYVACAADSIFAHEGTLTGSIGVIATFLRTDQLFEKVGLDVRVIKSGRYKDVGSPHRPMTDDEAEYLGGLLDTVYIQFLEAVSSGRGMPIETVRELAEGRLYTGEEAQAVGLIDRIGTYEDALRAAARMGGISGDPSVIHRRPRRSLFERIFGRAAPAIPLEGEQRVRLQYIIP